MKSYRYTLPSLFFLTCQLLITCRSENFSPAKGEIEDPFSQSFKADVVFQPLAITENGLYPSLSRGDWCQVTKIEHQANLLASQCLVGFSATRPISKDGQLEIHLRSVKPIPHDVLISFIYEDGRQSSPVPIHPFQQITLSLPPGQHIFSIPLDSVDHPSTSPITTVMLEKHDKIDQTAIIIEAIMQTSSNPSLILYDDDIRNGFVDGSWCVRNFKQQQIVFNGSFAISAELSQWKGLQLSRRQTIDIKAYQSLSFAIHGGRSGGQKILVGLTGTPKGTYRLPVENYLPNRRIEAGQWQQVQIPLSAFGIPQLAIQSIYFQDGSGTTQETIFLDDIQLRSGAAAPPPSPAQPTVTPPAPATASGWLRTQGNKILHADGRPFRGRGANIQDTRSCGACFGREDANEVKRRINVLVDEWKANFMRLTLESKDVSSVLTSPAYLADIQNIIQHIRTKPGVYVELSVWIDPSIDSRGWPTEQTNQVWRKLTQTFAKEPHVIFGIINEPQMNHDGKLNPQVWQAMNNAVAAIREEEAKHTDQRHLIAVQGTGGWARHLTYYMTNPITAGNGVNIVYETHVYDPISTFQERFITPATVLPVIIGEFGPATGYMSMADCTKLMEDAERVGVPYLAWTFHMRCPPNLIQDFSNNGCGIGMPIQATEWGNLLRNRLARPW